MKCSLPSLDVHSGNLGHSVSRRKGAVVLNLRSEIFAYLYEGSGRAFWKRKIHALEVLPLMGETQGSYSMYRDRFIKMCF